MFAVLRGRSSLSLQPLPLPSPAAVIMITSIKEQKVAGDIEKSKHSAEVSMDEKVSTDSIDLGNGDEALRLIGIERTAQFSEEYNLALRRKLVSSIFRSCSLVS